MKKTLLLITIGFLFIGFNAKAETTKDYGPFEVRPDLRMLDGDIAYTYSKKFLSDINYLYFKGKTFGPFNGSVDDFKVSNNSWGIKLRGVKSSVIINSKVYGPYFDSDKLFISDNFFGFSYTTLDNQNFININGKILGPYKGPSYVNFVNGNWLFSYYQDNKYFINIGDKILGPFDQIHNAYLTQDHYLVDVTKNGAREIIADGKEFFNQSTMYGIRINNDGWGFVYFKNGKNYVNYNGQEFGPYEDFGEMFKFELSGKNWYLNYTMNNPKNFIKNGIKQSSNLMPVLPTDPDAAKYKEDEKNGRTTLTINGTLFGSYKVLYGPFFHNNKWAFTYSKEGEYSDTIDPDTMSPTRLPNPEYFIKTNVINNSQLDPLNKNESEGVAVIKSGSSLSDFLKKNNKAGNPAKQIQIMKRYTEPFVKGLKLTTSQKYVINNFVVYGTKSNQHLNSDKRAAIILEFKKKYKKLPTTENDWNIIIANAKIKK